MKVRGSTYFASEDYFVQHADAPSRLLEGALETTKAVARSRYSVCKKAEIPAVDVQVNAANNQIDATARLAYDPDQANLTDRLEGDEKAITERAIKRVTRDRTLIGSERQTIRFNSQTQKQYHGSPLAHSDTEITIPHRKVIGDQPTLDVFDAEPLYDGATGSPISTTTQQHSSYS